ncbi:MAG: DNA integrity scanning protein DisA nucleotide-binding domain protein [Clostridia bacterium]|nr:DNA integrity scanning protein DisA nucleotide-binding domain protein [Clostridia bacterium]
MDNLTNYFQNIGWLSIVDAAVLIAFLVVVMVFFFRKKNYRVGIFFVLFTLFMVGVDVAISFFDVKSIYFTREILRMLAIIFIVASAVVYQSDLKLLFAKFGGQAEENVYAKLHNSRNEDDLRYASGEIVKACQNLAKNNIGALIVVCPTIISSNMLDTGIRLNSVLSAPLLESIFNPHAPLHDGAVIIKNNMVLAAGCFLPLSQNPSISKDLGTRHRAAIGITEESDVLTIVVSEETGIISLVQNGDIKRYITGEKLMDALDTAFGITDLSRRSSRQFGRNVRK